MDKQTNINQHCRSILVDWMVEIQENFEMNHETLYLGVKLVDFYLSKISVSKQSVQLVGATAMLIAAKYDVSFVFVCHINLFIAYCCYTYLNKYNFSLMYFRFYYL